MLIEQQLLGVTRNPNTQRALETCPNCTAHIAHPYAKHCSSYGYEFAEAIQPNPDQEETMRRLSYFKRASKRFLNGTRTLEQWVNIPSEERELENV